MRNIIILCPLVCCDRDKEYDVKPIHFNQKFEVGNDKNFNTLMKRVALKRPLNL